MQSAINGHEYGIWGWLLCAVCIALGEVIDARYRGKMPFFYAERVSTIDKRGKAKVI